MTTLKAKVNGQWVAVSSGGGGGTGTDEVWVSPTAPTDPNIELWYDSDAPSQAYADRWNSAWGIVAVGTFAVTALPAGVTKLTNDLTFKSITGRRYRMVLQIRIVGTTSANGINFLPIGPAVGGGSWDTWMTVGGQWNPLYTEALFTGNDVSGAFYWNANSTGQAVSVYLDSMSCFYIEDCGPVSYGTPPAVDPTPTAVAWTPMGTLQNGWVWYGGIEMPPAYRKVGDMVQIRGTIKNATPMAGGIQQFYVLPVGYRPPYTHTLPSMGVSDTDYGCPGIVVIDPAGRMSVVRSGTNQKPHVETLFEFQYSVTP
jgi:hypothetical protein